MTPYSTYRLRLPLLAAFCLAACLPAVRAAAHFPFIVADETGSRGKVVLSETLEVDPKVKTDRLAAGTKLSLRDAAGKDTPLTVSAGEHAMEFALSGKGTRLVHGTSDFGVRQRGEEPAYHLVYYPKAISGDPFESTSTVGTPVELLPARVEGGVKFRLLVDGKGAAGREVKIIEPDGGQSTQKTDADGFTEKFSRAGRYGAWARHWVDAPGKLGDAAYSQRRLYATLVVDYAAAPAAEAAAAADGPATVRATPFATLPEGVSSFGAVAADGWLYVYGGHTATTHDYSTATVSGRFRRINLRDPAKGEELPGGPILQGMNLVAHRGAIYRVGGMAPRNAPGEPKDNHSTAEFARFDPAAGKWAALPPAPSPRSSHDAVVVGDKLYAIGGWTQRGKEKSAWLDRADVLNLSSGDASWAKVSQPFVRRALTVTALAHEIYVLGGFDENNQSQLDVDILDTRTGAWRKGPPVPGERHNGFAPAACTLGGTIYLSVATGEMFRLSADRKSWEPRARATPRAVHRLIPDGSRILILGGAANQKMVNLIESVPAGGEAASQADAGSARR